MTLIDQANFICGKINQTDPEDVLACKGFLKKRNQMIWADQLWKDSLFEYTQTLATPGYAITSTWLPANKVLLLPAQFSHVVAVRTDTRKLNVEGSDHFYRIDFDSFQNSGTTTQYRNLPPAVWQFDTATQLFLQRSDPGDSTAAPRVRYLETDLVTIQTAAVPMTNATVLADTVTRIDSLSKLATTGQILAGLLYINGNLQLVFTTVLTLQPADITAARRCRIQLFGTVPENSTIRVLGKIHCPDFSDDHDEPALTGIDNCLLAFGQSDMLQRERQYGKAQACAQEGAALLEQLKRVQVVQQSHNARFIPEEGYGPDYQNYNSPLTF